MGADANTDARVRVALLGRLHDLDVARLARTALPSRASVGAALVLVALGVGAYAAARTTSVFAIERIDVRGARPGVTRDVREALRPLAGRSLVAFDEEELRRRLAAVPEVAGVHYDRAFPHSLVVTVDAQPAVALLRRGRSAWVVSATGRVVRSVARPGRVRLPRIWIGHDVAARAGTSLSDDRALASLAVARVVRRSPLRARVAAITATPDGGVRVELVSGRVIDLGAPSEILLKLTVALQVLRSVDAETRYVDVGVPARPVVAPSLNLEVEG